MENMKWQLVDIVQETNHKFLNFFTLHYEIEENGQKRPYQYFTASRHTKEELLAKTRRYDIPDGVVMALYKKEEDGIKTMLISQYRPPIGTYITSFPAGLLDEGDDIISAAIREAKEETGCSIANVEVVCPPSPSSGGLSDELVSIVIGEIVDIKDNQLEDSEDISSFLVPLEEAAGYLKDPNRVMALSDRLGLLYLLARFR